MLHQTPNHPETVLAGAGVNQDIHNGEGLLHLDAPRARSPSALTIVAHDLRSPLASLRLLVELIEIHGAAQSIDKLSSCIERANNIIDGLEDMLNSVLERVLRTGDPLDFEPGTVTIDQTIMAGIETSRAAAEHKSVKVFFQMSDPLRVRGDGRLLSQVIENLVGNAIKHSNAGMAVTCSLSRVGTQAVFCVKDTGNGLTKRDLQSAFSPFTTLSSKSKDSSKSWGLGLWIVRLIVERHGGRIVADSKGPGTGSSFSVFLPLIQ